MTILDIGTVIETSNEAHPLMIIGHFPKYKQGTETGYFDYLGCLFPEGKNSEEFYFFNNENIKKVFNENELSKEKKDILIF